MAVAHNYSAQMDFAISDKNSFRTELRSCGYSEEKINSHHPLLCIFQDENRFKMEMNFDREAFAEAVNKFLGGKTQR